VRLTVRDEDFHGERGLTLCWKNLMPDKFNRCVFGDDAIRRGMLLLSGIAIAGTIPACINTKTEIGRK
jgi:hypothetical protein